MFLRRKIKENRGSVFIIIFVAIALFAALSFALVQGGGSSAGIEKEQALLEQNEVLDYITQAQGAAKRLKLINRCGSIFYYNAGNLRCSLTAVEGGALRAWKNYDVTAPADVGVSVSTSPVAGIGTTASETIITITAIAAQGDNFSYEACRQFNVRKNVPGNPSCPAYAPRQSQILTNAPADAGLNGHMSFCAANAADCDPAANAAGAAIIGVLLRQ